jgi:hypothetical protein
MTACFHCGADLPSPPRFPRGYCSVQCMQSIHRSTTSDDTATGGDTSHEREIHA